MNDKRYVIVNLKNVITKLGEDRLEKYLILDFKKSIIKPS